MSKKTVVISFFMILFIMGVFIHKDYGIGVDEPTNRQNGAISTKYILTKAEAVFGFKILKEDIELNATNTNLKDYVDRDYGVLFDVTAFIFERILGIDEISEGYKFRKILTYIVFLVGLFSLYRIATVRFNNYGYGLIAVAVVIFSPRIFGESFYNSKDVIFMAIFTIAIHRMLNYINNPTIKNAIYFGLATGCAIDIRVIAVVLTVMVMGLVILKIIFSNIKFKVFALSLFYYFVISIFTMIMFWPWLWEDPIGHFLEAFKNMSHFRLNRWELFNGKFHTTTNLPWYYLPKWILITTPIAYIIFLIIGLFSIVNSFIKVENRYILTNNKIQDLTYLMVLFGPIIAAVSMNSVVYNGWRHFYFIYPAMVLIIINGIAFIMRSGYYVHASRIGVISILFFTFVMTATNMINSHPLQYIYFNKFTGKDLEKKYPMDYASLSAIKGFEYLDRYDDKPIIKVSTFGPLNITLPKTLLLLSQTKKIRFQLVDNPSDADYIFSDYQFFNPQESDAFYKNLKLYESIFDLKVKNGVVFSIFKHN